MSGYVSEELGRKGLSVLLVGRGKRLEPVVIDNQVQALGDKVECNDCKNNNNDKINLRKHPHSTLKRLGEQEMLAVTSVWVYVCNISQFWGLL